MSPPDDVLELITGAFGTPAGVRFALAVENGPWPTEFTAATLNWYVVPFVKPVTTIDVAVEAACGNVVDDAQLFDE
jgi:hypothetical protein